MIEIQEVIKFCHIYLNLDSGLKYIVTGQKAKTNWIRESLLNLVASVSRDTQINIFVEIDINSKSDIETYLQDDEVRVNYEGQIITDITQVDDVGLENLVAVSHKQSHINHRLEEYKQKLNDYEDIPATIVTGIHQDYFDVPIFARIFREYIDDSRIAVPATMKMFMFAPFLAPLGALYFFRNGPHAHRQNVLKRAFKREYPMLGVFLNASTKEESQKIGVGASLWSMEGIGVTPIMINYLDDDYKFPFGQPGNVEVIIGKDIDPIKTDELINEEYVLGFLEKIPYWVRLQRAPNTLERLATSPNGKVQNRFTLKEYSYNVMKKMYNLALLRIPEKYSEMLDEARL